MLGGSKITLIEYHIVNNILLFRFIPCINSYIYIKSDAARSHSCFARAIIRLRNGVSVGQRAVARAFQKISVILFKPIDGSSD